MTTTELTLAEDTRAIIETCTRFVWHIDMREWDKFGTVSPTPSRWTTPASGVVRLTYSVRRRSWRAGPRCLVRSMPPSTYLAITWWRSMVTARQ